MSTLRTLTMSAEQTGITFRQRLRVFLDRPHIPLLGLLIVFATYVVKEGLSDQWRDEATRIDLAQIAFSVRQSDSDLARQLENLEKILNDSGSAAPSFSE